MVEMEEEFVSAMYAIIIKITVLVMISRMIIWNF